MENNWKSHKLLGGLALASCLLFTTTGEAQPVVIKRHGVIHHHHHHHHHRLHPLHRVRHPGAHRWRHHHRWHHRPSPRVQVIR
jgi:hypothetical protein